MATAGKQWQQADIQQTLNDLMTGYRRLEQVVQAERDARVQPERDLRVALAQAARVAQTFAPAHAEGDRIRLLETRLLGKPGNFDGTILESAPHGSHQNIGAVEKTSRTIGEQVRIMRLQLETQIKDKMGLKEAVAAWIVRHVRGMVSQSVPCPH
eukprot:4369925-Amphidinium_carterae.1